MPLKAKMSASRTGKGRPTSSFGPAEEAVTSLPVDDECPARVHDHSLQLFASPEDTPEDTPEEIHDECLTKLFPGDCVSFRTMSANEKKHRT